jgi:hypothetical protein
LTPRHCLPTATIVRHRCGFAPERGCLDENVERCCCWRRSRNACCGPSAGPLERIRRATAVRYPQRDVFIERSGLDWIPVIVAGWPHCTYSSFKAIAPAQHLPRCASIQDRRRLPARFSVLHPRAMLASPDGDPADVHHGAVEVDLVPAQIADLGCPQAVPVVRRTMVASRWPCRLPRAASISASTSPGVRCSRVRRSAFALRFGATVRFTSVGATTRRWDFAMQNRRPRMSTVRISHKIRTV